MDFSFRSTIALTIAIYTFGHTINTVNGNDLCTLDGMRDLAANACDLLWRHIRSADDGIFELPYHIVDSKNLSETDLPHSHHHHHHHHHHNRHLHDNSRVHIRKREFPSNGYLLVDQHLSKYLVPKKLDELAYAVNDNSIADNDDNSIIFMDYDNNSQHNHHLQRHRHRRHPRFPRQGPNIEYCCRNPENDKCSINLC